ncbi:hemerythrin domain-containing protein [Thermus thermamylovorans]|uniref:Hemerythrin domain-containing protein n=1 Tax=Thermus thermamylovorans TaxID=2509362 RepID=A0A4Q9B417_9DEIN|nr:hemerythrin domain-containing protein [Thermus thermamylovorans]TBH20066.1 hemerythrin domain-containing protein [Thermus thermamylovorans]
MVAIFRGRDLIRPGGRVAVLELSPGEEVPVQVQKGEDALLAAIQGELKLRFWSRSLEVRSGEVARLRRGKLVLSAPKGGRALLVVLGISPESLARDHERLLALLEALPAREAAEALAQAFEEHIAKEEALYYPTLSPGKLKERLLEHRLLRELLTELLKALKEGRSTEGIVQRLKTAFQAHSEAELEG